MNLCLIYILHDLSSTCGKILNICFDNELSVVLSQRNVDAPVSKTGESGFPRVEIPVDSGSDEFLCLCDLVRC